VSTLSELAEHNDDSAATANGYCLQLIRNITIFEIGFMKNVLEHAYFFLKEIERGESTIDKFSLCLDSMKEAIANTMNMFDFDLYKKKLQAVGRASPNVANPSQTTRRTTIQANNQDIDTEKLIEHGYSFVDRIMKSIEDRFNNNSRTVVDNIVLFSNPSNYDDNTLMGNDLLTFYCEQMHFQHISTNKDKYQRTDEPILDRMLLKKQLPSFRSLTKKIKGIIEITQHLAKTDLFITSQWFTFYQILSTYPLGVNECERSFSAVTRIKTKLRNRLGTDALETAVKYTMIKPDVTDEDIDYIVTNFYSNPGCAKSRNVRIYIDE
ncbi:unnamed protein product, partial [Didymodactylos carnosus]